MIANMFYIAVIVTVIWNCGFFDVIDSELSKRVRFHHLPHIFFCSFCGCWWSELLLIIITGHFTLFYIMMALLFALSTIPLVAIGKTIDNSIYKVIELVNNILK